MEEIFQISALCMVGTILAVVLKKGSPEFGLLITMVVIAVMMGSVIASMKEIWMLIQELALRSQVKDSLCTPLYKAIAIACVVRIGSCLCKDAGESALAAALELSGTVCTLVISVPLVRTVLSILLELMK